MFAAQVCSLPYRKLDFEEFAAAATSVHQLEGSDSWEQHARQAYEFFEKDGNRPIVIEELASVWFSFIWKLQNFCSLLSWKIVCEIILMLKSFHIP